jgi:ech hydrogenase subunit E
MGTSRPGPGAGGSVGPSQDAVPRVAPGRTVIPFGPQHPVLPEPIHLDLVLEDETVVEAIPKIGFVHRGFEKLVEKMDFNELVYVADRICGICAFIHSMAYCQGVEAVM